MRTDRRRQFVAGSCYRDYTNTAVILPETLQQTGDSSQRRIDDGSFNIDSNLPRAPDSLFAVECRQGLAASVSQHKA